MSPARPGRRLAVPAAILAVAAGVAATAAIADDHSRKTFATAITATPDSAPSDAGAQAWAGAAPRITISITNRAREQRLGSANVTIPAGIALAPGAPLTLSPAGATAPVVAGGVIKLRNLALSLTARVPCAPANPYVWATAVKQSNDFNGTGNDFTIATPQPALRADGRCSLAFTADGQPASAQRNTTITADPYTPAGPRPVRVEVLDGSGAARVSWWTAPITVALGANPAGGTLAGTLTAVPAAGVASFAPTLNRSSGGYRLTAASTGIPGPGPQSSAFTIVDTAQRCTAGATCTGSSSRANTQATVTSGDAATGDLLVLSLGPADAPSLDCPSYTETGEILLFDVTTGTGGPAAATKTVRYTVLSPTRSASLYQLCFRSPLAFTARTRLPAPRQADGTFLGLLPDCSKYSPAPPCVQTRSGGKGGTPVILTVLAPQGDPWIRG